MKKRISILGSTGSIGVQTLDVVRYFSSEFEIIGLSAGKNIALLEKQIQEFKPKYISVTKEADAEKIANFLKKEGIKSQIFFGEQGLINIAENKENQLLVVAIVGTASLLPTYKAILKGTPIGLACKEVLVAAGFLIMDLAKKNKVPILPIDSEHAAIKQCLAAVDEDPKKVDKLILTASGGPFWNVPLKNFKNITKEKALKHPKWNMGAKITIDSATMLNKGLEVIEAHHLFSMPYDKIEIIIHPQSIVHSMVQFNDGTVLSQMSQTDMRYPIQYVLTYPEKLANTWLKYKFGKLEFFEPDFKKFPLLKLAYMAGNTGHSATLALNAANEAAVELFLAEKIKFLEIYPIIKSAIDIFAKKKINNIDDIVELDIEIKRHVKNQYR